MTSMVLAVSSEVLFSKAVEIIFSLSSVLTADPPSITVFIISIVSGVASIP